MISTGVVDVASFKDKLPHEGHVPTLPGRTNTSERYITFSHDENRESLRAPRYIVFTGGNTRTRLPVRAFQCSLEGFFDAIAYRDEILGGHVVNRAPRVAAPHVERGPGRVVIPKNFPMPTLQNREAVEALFGEIDIEAPLKKARAARRTNPPRAPRKNGFVAYLYVAKFYHPLTGELLLKIGKRGVSTPEGLNGRFGEAMRYGADVDLIIEETRTYDTEQEMYAREAELDEVARKRGWLRWSDESYYIPPEEA